MEAILVVRGGRIPLVSHASIIQHGWQVIVESIPRQGTILAMCFRLLKEKMSNQLCLLLIKKTYAARTYIIGR
jgi:hypothetical protein